MGRYVCAGQRGVVHFGTFSTVHIEYFSHAPGKYLPICTIGLPRPASPWLLAFSNLESGITLLMGELGIFLV